MMTTQTKETQATLTPHKALELLVEGNRRFQSNGGANRDLLAQVKETAGGQFPLAVILSCIDSRVPAEIVFDQGVGDVFSARVAGNVLNEDIVGSMEFACKLAGAMLIVVMGHSSCGAVKGACNGAELGHLSGLLEKIKPAIDAAQAERELPPDELVQRVADANVENVVREIRTKSTVLEEMIQSGMVGVVGAMYSVQTGKVEFSQLACGA